MQSKIGYSHRYKVPQRKYDD